MGASVHGTHQSVPLSLSCGHMPPMWVTWVQADAWARAVNGVEPSVVQPKGLNLWCDHLGQRGPSKTVLHVLGPSMYLHTKLHVIYR